MMSLGVSQAALEDLDQDQLSSGVGSESVPPAASSLFSERAADFN